MSFHFYNWPRQSGALGVGLFFCISGYLITSILLDELEEVGTIQFKRFYVRRARRLLPLAYMVIFLTAISFTFLRITGHGKIDERQLMLSSVFCLLYVGNFFGLAHLGFNDLATPIGHFWTLAVEEQFYLVWPIFIILITRKLRKDTTVAVVSTLIAMALILHTVFSLVGLTVWTLPTSYLDILLAGCLLSIMQFRKGFLLTSGKFRYFAIPTVILATWIFTSKLTPESLHGQGYSVFAIVEFAAFMTFASIKSIGKLTPLIWLGDMSYSLYCIHFPVLIALDYLIAGAWLRIPLALALTFTLSILSRRLFEPLFWKSRFTSESIVDAIISPWLLRRARISQVWAFISARFAAAWR